MISFYLLISVMPMLRHPLWSEFIGDFTVIKYLGAICAGYALVYVLSRSTPVRFFETWQARWFVLFCFLGMASYATMAVPQRLETNPFLSYLSFLLFFFVTLVLVDSLERLRYTLLVAIGSVGFASLHLLREWQKYGGMSAGYRPGWVTGDPNYYSISALLCLPVAFYLLRTKQAQWERWFCISSIVLMLLGLTLAASRGALIGLAVGSLLVVARSQRFGRNIFILFVVLLPLMAFAPSSPLSRLFSPDRSDQESTDRRFGLWDIGLQMIQAHPLTGIGAGNFKPLSQSFDPSIGEAGVAHNTYIEIAAELGIPGLLLFVAILISTAQTLARLRRATRDSGPALIYHASEAIQVGLMGALVALSFMSGEYQKLLWLTIFLTMCLPSLAVEATHDSPSPDSRDNLTRRYFEPTSSIPRWRSRTQRTQKLHGLNRHHHPAHRRHRAL